MRWALLAGAIALLAFFAGVRSDEMSAPIETPPAANEETVVTREESVALELPPSTAAAIGAALGRHLGRINGAEGAIAGARAGSIDSVELGRRLRETAANHPELGERLLRALEDETSPGIALQLAQALAGLENDAPLRLETIASLRAGSAEMRAVGMLALLGRGEPDALQLAADTLAADTPEARATAAFILNNAPAGLTGPAADRARSAAREAIADPRAGARLREEVTTLLGQPGAAETDLALLEHLLFEGEPAVRMRALAALDAAEADITRLRNIIGRVTEDPAAPARLLEMAKAWRAAHP